MQLAVAGAFVVLAVTLGALAPETQHAIASTLRASVLRPFIAAQEEIARTRASTEQLHDLRARVDSLSAVLLTQSTLADENRTLRELLELGARIGPEFRGATLIRPGTPGSESMFLLDVGARHGVRPGVPVVNAQGLVGAIREVGVSSSVGMDWTHPDFRASAMVSGSVVYGIVENRRGAFREEDRLTLTGTAYNEVLVDGSVVLTSGLGVYPRGIPIGVIDGVADFQGAWRKSYWIRPAVQPAAVTHVLVAVTEGLDLAWPLSDTLAAEETTPDSASGTDEVQP